jgi:hypothetical protein
LGQKIGHTIVGCSSLSASTYLSRHNQLATKIHQQTAIQYKLLDRNTLPYDRYKPEPVLALANVVLYWDRSIITDKTVAFSRHGIMFFDREKKIATCNGYSCSLDP